MSSGPFQVGCVERMRWSAMVTDDDLCAVLAVGLRRDGERVQGSIRHGVFAAVGVDRCGVAVGDVPRAVVLETYACAIPRVGRRTRARRQRARVRQHRLASGSAEDPQGLASLRCGYGDPLAGAGP